MAHFCRHRCRAGRQFLLCRDESRREHRHHSGGSGRLSEPAGSICKPPTAHRCCRIALCSSRLHRASAVRRIEYRTHHQVYAASRHRRIPQQCRTGDYRRPVVSVPQVRRIRPMAVDRAAGNVDFCTGGCRLHRRHCPIAKEGAGTPSRFVRGHYAVHLAKALLPALDLGPTVGAVPLAFPPASALLELVDGTTRDAVVSVMPHLLLVSVTLAAVLPPAHCSALGEADRIVGHQKGQP